MHLFDAPLALTPQEFELTVKEILDGSGAFLQSYESKHLERLSGVDGEYVIDVTARFSALGADYLVLVECKHQQRKVERQDVQILRDKVGALSAHKGMLFSTAGFQKGALEYGDKHKIALVQIARGETTWFTRDAGPKKPAPASACIPKYVGWWHDRGSWSVLSKTKGEYTREALDIQLSGKAPD